MEVYKKMEQLSTTVEETEAETVSDRETSEADDLPDSIIVNADSNEPFHCEAVAKDDGSVQYECSATIDEAGSNSSQSGTGAQNKPVKAKQHGKFSLNVSYVIQFNTIISF